MADDDIVETDEEFIEPEGEEEEVDDLVEPIELDEDELEEVLEVDDEFVAADDFEEVVEEDEDDTEGPVRKSVVPGADEDDDDDILAPDDVEADLDTILKDRLVAEQDEGNEDDEEPEDRTETGDRLQPKRADEQLCPSCFLLVRQNAPGCPVGDDDCPLFS